jgi:hypothetical protein
MELHEFAGLLIIHAPFFPGWDTIYPPIIDKISDIRNLIFWFITHLCLEIFISKHKIDFHKDSIKQQIKTNGPTIGRRTLREVRLCVRTASPPTKCIANVYARRHNPGYSRIDSVFRNCPRGR